MQQLSSQKQIESKTETIKVNFDDFSFEYKSNWKKVENKKESHILTLERMNGTYKSKIQVSASNVPQDFEKFENEVKDLVVKNGFALDSFEKRNVNGIDMLYVSSSKTPIELDVWYFNSQKHQFGIFLINAQSNAIAKKEYEDIINSIKVKNQIAEFGEKSDVKMNFCPNCGNPISHEGHFCQNCGYKLD